MTTRLRAWARGLICSGVALLPPALPAADPSGGSCGSHTRSRVERFAAHEHGEAPFRAAQVDRLVEHDAQHLIGIGLVREALAQLDQAEQGAGVLDPGQCTTAGGALPSAAIGLGWTSKSRLGWNGEACSTVYDVYRTATSHFVDGNHDGLADDYGACFDPDRTVPETYDESIPSALSFQAYLVTGENAQGEGTLGTNRAGAIRPNNSPCP